MLQELLAHSHAGVADSPAVGHDAIFNAKTAAGRLDLAADFIVFDTVAVDIQENLADRRSGLR